MPSRHQPHLAAGGVDLSQQRRLLLRRPNTTPLDPSQNIHVRQTRLLLELQKEPPETSRIAGPRARRYTAETGRLRPAAAQVRPGVLRYAITTMPNVIDPHFSAGFQVRDITYAVFDTLFAVDDHYRPSPQMVDRWR